MTTPMDGVPPLTLPFPSRINPHTPGLAGPLMRWASEWGEVPDSVLPVWRAAKFEQLVGRMYPGADPALLPVIGEAVLWLFLYDDHLDPGRPGDDRDYAEQTATRAKDILRGAITTRPEDPLLRCLWRFSNQLKARTEPRWWQRCAADLAGFVGSMQHEVHARAADEQPGLKAYVRARRFTSGWFLLADLAELSAGPLCDQVVACDLYAELRSTSGDVACAINDLLSLDKETAAGERHNLVLVLQHARQCDRATATDLARQWMDSRLQGYLAANRRFRTHWQHSGRLDAREWAVAARCVDGLENLMRGSLDWSVETGRYAHAVPEAAGSLATPHGQEET